jgi:S-formylglutathione hydrolase
MERISEQKCHDGVQGFYRHASASTGTDMRFALFLPPQARRGPAPVVLYLAGLTCTEETATIKANAQRFAAEHGLALVFPDTSPRGAGVPGEDDDWDLGTGAGFYIDAAREPWARNYRMESYIADELPALVGANFPVSLDRMGIMGHSMGGHGALTLALKHPDRFRSVSAFAPICHPVDVPWGWKAFTAYLGPDRDAWAEHDATLLVARRPTAHAILIDQGDADQFLAEQLRPEAFEKACAAAGQQCQLRMQAGYDHSYYFIQTFIADHIAHHARILHGR